MLAPARKLATPRNQAALPTPTAAPSGIATGPTVLLEDSQVFVPPTQSSASQVRRTPRVRTILTAEAEAEAIQLTNEGKITAKNAWNIKLLEGIHDSVSNALSSGSEESATQFTKCANLVEGGAKIWTQRVEHTAVWSQQVLRRLHRNDGKGDDDNEGAEGDDGQAGADGRGNAAAAAKRARKRERTVAECLSEVNMDARTKAQTILQSSAVSAQFRAITEKFEQGHAQGLLLNNAPMGSVGNLILDVDYSRSSTRGTSLHRPSGGDHLDHLGHAASPGRPRLSTVVLATEALSPGHSSENLGSGTLTAGGDLSDDASGADALDDQDHLRLSIVLDPPNQRPSWGCLSERSETNAKRSSKRLDAAVAAANDLMVSNVTGGSLKQEISSPQEGSGGGNRSSSPGQEGGRASGTGGVALSGSPRASTQQGGAALWDDNDGGDDGEIGDDYNDGGDDMDDEYMGQGERGRDSDGMRSQAYSTSRAASSVRDLVSGAAELDFYDRIVGGGATEHLALAADDPNSWFPMTQTESGVRAFANKGSFLQQVRREKLVLSQTAAAASSASSGALQTAGGSGASQRKKARTEAVRIGENLDEFLDHSDLQLASHENKIMNPRRERLKLTTEELRDRFSYHASCAIARENDLLLPEVTAIGALPWWMPKNAEDVAAFFQPFCTASPAWNLLSKRVSSAGDDAATLAANLGRSSTAVADERMKKQEDDAVVEMPLHVFDDDEAGDYDDGLLDDDGTDIAYAANFDLPRGPSHNDDADADHDDAVTTHFVAAGEELGLMEAPDVVRVLQSRQAIVPTQVDVVRLRRVMWQQTQRILKEEPTVIMVPDADDNTHTGTRSFGAKRSTTGVALKRPRFDDDEGTDQPASGDGSGFHPVPFHRFSEVVAGVLPQVPTISTTGTLSPAFFFFSLLFLANEHSILLENVKGDVQDVYISGVLGPNATPVALSAAAH